MNNDILEILNMHNEYFLDKKSYEEIKKIFLDSRYIIKKSYANNKIIGYIILYDSIDSYDIYEIAIKKEMRKRGYAQQLIDTIPKDRPIFLEVCENNIEAINLYLKNGFQKISVRKKYYIDGSNAFVMKK